MTYPDIDPVALSLGPLTIHWYGVLYLVAFASAWWLGRYRARQPQSGWQAEQIEDLIFYGGLGVVLGGRIGYVLFYNFGAFLDNPLILVTVWQGGMSFHGGLLGVMFALWLYARKQQRGYFSVLDFVAPLVPLGLGAGRIGNFINGELWGKVSDAPWAMVFPGGGPEPRHPSMLYEFFLEGVVLFLLVWLYSRRPRPTMAVSGLFGACYGLFRILVEFVRMPDAHIGYLAFGWVTKGMLLSLPMVVIGVGMMLYAYRKGYRH
jgi:phosphatidylglycerol:prolipoprotein diacylglycerol transferase